MNEPKSVCPPKRFRWLISPETPGTVRIDRLLRQNLPGLSRRLWAELFSRQYIRKNGRPAVKGEKAHSGDLLEVLLPGPLDPFPIPDQSPKPKVYYEDSALVILEKPGRQPCHPLSPFETGTLANTLAFHWPQTLGVGNHSLEPGLVHRLDTGTSGLLVVALHPEAWTRLKQDLQSRKWEKTYLALVEGILTEPRTLSLPLAHDSQDRRKMKTVTHSETSRRGRVYRAETRIRPMTRFPSHTLLEVDLLTGVTHQIRVHLASCGHPVAGDTLYGSVSGPGLGLESGRFFLHAHQLSLPHPMSRQSLHFRSELLEDLQEGLARLGSPVDSL